MSEKKYQQQQKNEKCFTKKIVQDETEKKRGKNTKTRANRQMDFV